MIPRIDTGLRPSSAGFYTDPEIVSIHGTAVTSDDIRRFDNKWMTQDQHDLFISVIHNAFWVAYDQFGIPFESVVWMIGERMAAMARMFDLTGASKYLDHLRELSNLVLLGRDDHIDLQPEPPPQSIPSFQPNPPSRADGIRGNRVMPAWGYKGVGAGGFHHSALVVAGVYAYPVAAFARIVAENPALQAVYGADARSATSSLLEMLDAFSQELHDQSLTPGRENYFANPVGNRLLTQNTCYQAYDAATEVWLEAVFHGNLQGANDASANLATGYQHCYRDFHDSAGLPLAHNEYQAFVMMLIELSRAVDSDLYKGNLSVADTQRAEDAARVRIPLIVAGAQRYYRNRFSQATASNGRPHFLWHYLDDGPSYIPHDLDNTPHAALEMSYLGLLWRNKDRLNALLASSPAGPDQLALTAADMTMLANTFLDIVVQEHRDPNGVVNYHLADNLSGTLPSPVDAWDGACDGWINLAEFDSRVYSTCASVTLHQWDPSVDVPSNDPTMFSAQQPHLGIGNHAALLALKRFAPA